jgi:hypothetical protein
MSSGARDELPRTNLPIPEREHVGLTTYDAKDPGTSFPPIEPLLPPAGGPNVLVVLIGRHGVRRVECVRRPDRHPERGAPCRQARQ